MPFGPRDIRLPVQREITIPGGVTPQQDAADVVAPTFAEVAEIGADLEQKSTELMATMEELSASARIPVDATVPDVRAAVARLDPTSGGRYITFKLFRALLHERYEAYEGIDIAGLMDSLSGIAVADGKRFQAALSGLRSTTQRSEDDDVVAGLADLGLHLAVLWASQEMTGAFDAPDKAASTAFPNPGAVAIQIALAWALIFGGRAAVGKITDLLTGNSDPGATQREIENTLRDSGIDETLIGHIKETLFSNAIPLEPPKSSQALTSALHDSDALMAIQYSQDYLNHSSDPSLYAWRKYFEAADTYYSSRVLRLDVGDLSTSFTLPTAGSDLIGRVDNLGQNLLMPGEVMRTVVCDANRLNNVLDSYATLLQSRYTQDIVCCLIRFLGAVGEDDIAALRSMRDVLSMGLRIGSFDLKNLFNDISARLQSYLERRILMRLIQLLQQFFSGIVDPLLEWYNSSDERWQILFRCVGIEDLVAFVLQAIEKIQDVFQELVLQWFEKVEFGKQQDSLRIGKDLELEWMRRMIRLLDSVIAAVGSGNLCAEDDIFPPAAQALNVASGIVQPDIRLTVDGSPYRRFNPTEIRTPWNWTPPKPAQPPTDENPQRDVDDCTNRLTGASAVEFQRNATAISAQLKQLVQKHSINFDESQSAKPPLD